jgi:hypothetical protein
LGWPELPSRPAAPAAAESSSRLTRIRAPLGDGACTTLHVASYRRGAFRPRVVLLERPAPLVRWCERHRVSDAIVGGFFVRAQYEVLGELRIAGERLPSVPFDSPWSAVRACAHIDGEALQIVARDGVGGEPAGDLLQAGPLLVRDGRIAVADGEDREGFSAAAHQFDSDITAGRYPRAALGLAGDRMLAVACDGRTDRDAGMTLSELAHSLVALGVSDAINLDGGGSASLVHDGRLRNRPREPHGVDLLDGRPVMTAVVFER